jgi:hypothetical protein
MLMLWRIASKSRTKFVCKATHMVVHKGPFLVELSNRKLSLIIESAMLLRKENHPHSRAGG